MTEAIDIHALAGAYALDAVDDLERAAFDRHLHHCETCALEVAELRETTARMAGAVAEPPPPGMRDAVLAAIARTPQQRDRRADPRSHGHAGSSQRWRRFTAAAVAAGVAAVGGGFVSWSIAEDRVHQARVEAAQDRRIADVLGAPDAVVRTAPMADGQVTIVVSRSQNHAVAIVRGLRNLSNQELYQLWWEDAATKKMVHAAKLRPGTGNGTVFIETVGNVDAFGVSHEPAPAGSEEVTLPNVVGTMPVV
jgi:anti-sigma-K factor RskA